jgi:hypothetical protein
VSSESAEQGKTSLPDLVAIRTREQLVQAVSAKLRKRHEIETEEIARVLSAISLGDAPKVKRAPRLVPLHGIDDPFRRSRASSRV